MDESFLRTQLILGEAALEKLAASRVALFGLGGVGGYALEALVRSGVGHLLLVDNDRFSESNLNRQILATRDSLGKEKTAVARARALSINPACDIEIRNCFFLPETRDSFSFQDYDYVIDAIDTVSGKLCLIEAAQAAGVPIISCMGSGNKTDLSKLKISDIYHSSICPLARVMRREAKKRQLAPFPVVFSTESPREILAEERHWLDADRKERQEQGLPRKDIPGSTAFVPAAAGLLLAQHVVQHLINP